MVFRFKLSDYICLWWTTVFFLGFLPASGTVTSLVVLLVVGGMYFGGIFSLDTWQWVWGVGSLFVTGLGIWASGYVAKYILMKKDPSEIVIDEVAGIWISLGPIFFFPPKEESVFLVYGVWVLAFVLFRVLDIFKPSIIGKAEELPDGWGIMLDDVLSGVISAGVILLVLWFLSSGRFNL